MDIQAQTALIISELENLFQSVHEEQSRNFCEKILKAPRVYLAGAGRSGLMMRAFAMRLMHMGVQAFFVSDTATPGAQKGDLLIIASASGQTGSLIALTEKAAALHVDLVLLTAKEGAALSAYASFSLILPLPAHRKQPLGSLFEQSVLLFSDACVLYLMEALHIDEESMLMRHANLE